MTPILIHIRPWDLDAAARIDVRVGSSLEPEAYGLNALEWKPAVLERPAMSIETMSTDLSGGVQVGKSRFTVLLHAAGITPDRNIKWGGATVKIYAAQALAWPAITEFDGEVVDFSVDLDSRVLTISAEVSTSRIEKPLLTEEFTGGGGITGDAAKRGTLKPAGFGACENIEPVWFDETRSIGMIDGYSNCTSISALMEGASDMGARVADYANYTALAAAIDAHTVPPGRWATCVAEGLVGLGAPPVGQVGVNAVFGTNRLGAMMSRILQTHAGVSSGLIDTASFTALDAALPYATHYWTRNQQDVKSLLEKMARSGNATLLLSFQGLVAVSRAVATASVATLDRSGSQIPRCVGWKVLPPLKPVWKIKARVARPVDVLTFDQVNYVDTIIDRGLYGGATVYRAGNLVWLDDKSSWLYINALAESGHAPPTWPTTSDSYWQNISAPLDYADITGATKPDDNATRNDDGANMLRAPITLELAAFSNSATLSTTGSSGRPADAYRAALSGAAGSKVYWDDKIPCVPGETLYYRHVCQSTVSTADTCNAGYDILGSTGSVIGSFDVSGTILTGAESIGVWKTKSGKIVTPAGAAYIRPYAIRPTWGGVATFYVAEPWLSRSDSGATVGAPAGSLVGTVMAETVAASSTNFDANNDRNATTPTNPTITGGGVAFTKVLNTDGSADVTFNWNYTTSSVPTAANNIDGFRIHFHSALVNTDYVFGTTPSTETIAIVSSGARAITFPGVPADAYYTIGVQAYRDVDTDVDTSGRKLSSVIKSTAAGEHPYQPSSTVTFDGNVSGEVNAVPVATLTANAANGATAYTGTTKYRTAGAPTNNPAPSSITITANTNGTRNIRIDWGTYTQGANQADFLLIFWKKAGTAPGVTDSSVAVRVNTAGAAYYIFEGVNPADAMSFGIAAARRTENGLEVGTIQAPTSAPTWVNVTTATPNYTANIDGTAAATVVTNASNGAAVATNFNARNDRNGTTPTAPTIPTGGTAIDHTINTDGSADISFEWTYTTSSVASDPNNIDGFQIYVRSSTSATAYTFGTTPVEEFVFEAPADKRAFVLPGVPADRHYTFGVRAYRAVDSDIDTSGFKNSAIIKSAVAGENPYQPSVSVPFAGNVIGTIDGTAAATVTGNAASAFTGTANYRATGAPTNNPTPSGITITTNSNGTRNIQLNWNTYTQGALQADVIMVFWNKTSSAAALTDSSVSVKVNTAGGSYYIFEGVNPADVMSFGIAAARRTESGLEVGPIQSPAVTPQWVNVTTSTPNFTGNVGGIAAATVVSNAAAGAAVATNFNANNDRNATTPTAPVLLTDLTAIDHTINTDGSANISIEWTYTHSLVATDANNIDGFLIYIRSSTSASTYTFGTTVAEEVVYTVPYDKRALIIRGVPANLFYTIGVQAYRSVDSDVDTSGTKRSSIVKATGADENPYRPSPTTAFLGDVDGTVNGTAASTVTTNAANGQTAFVGTAGYRTTGAPSNNPSPSVAGGITITANTNGTRNIKIAWDAYSQGARPADFLLIFWTKTSSAPGYNDSSVAVKVNGGAAYYMFEGVNPADVMSFGIAAARRTENGLEVGTIQAPTSSPQWVNVAAATPNYTANINAVAATTITTGITNFNGRNDRDNTAVVTPTIATNGTAVDHTINTDGSADISLEWSWAGSNVDIDGWEVMVVGSTSASTYTQGTTPALEQIFPLPPDKRAFFLYGVAANLYWTFAVRAKRIVDPDVNAAGFIASSWVQPSAAATGGSENPYRPSANVAFAGDISATVGYAPMTGSVMVIPCYRNGTTGSRMGSQTTLQLSRSKGNTDVTSSTTWSVTAPGGFAAGSITSAGVLTCQTGTSNDGYVLVTGTYESIDSKYIIGFDTIFGMPDAVAGHAFSFGAPTALTGLASTTDVDLSGIVAGRTGAGANMYVRAWCAGSVDSSGTFAGKITLLWRPIGGSWTAVTSNTMGTLTYDPNFSVQRLFSIGTTVAGLAANTDYEFKIQAQRQSGTAPGTVTLKMMYTEGY